jgi:protein TonB
VWRFLQNVTIGINQEILSHSFQAILVAAEPKSIKVEKVQSSIIDEPVFPVGKITAPSPRSFQKTTKIKPPSVKPALKKEFINAKPVRKETKIENANVSQDSVYQVVEKVNIKSDAVENSSDKNSYTEANFKVNYAVNPKPVYPDIAKNRGWQGTVLLKVRVTTDGRSDEVILHSSSGYKILDTSAIAAVEKWQFFPAKQGNTPIVSTVIVPIVFSLNQ